MDNLDRANLVEKILESVLCHEAVADKLVELIDQYITHTEEKKIRLEIDFSDFGEVLHDLVVRSWEDATRKVLWTGEVNNKRCRILYFEREHLGGYVVEHYERGAWVNVTTGELLDNYHYSYAEMEHYVVIKALQDLAARGGSKNEQ